MSKSGASRGRRLIAAAITSLFRQVIFFAVLGVNSSRPAGGVAV